MQDTPGRGTEPAADSLSSSRGCLYIVATPIGNLSDLSDRARQTLTDVDLIAAEDTRRTQTLLAHLGLHRPLQSCHEHNEREKSSQLVEALASGKSVALVTDAGVPVISDPGSHLVATAWERGFRVIPIPGPSAVLSALSVSGFNSDRFFFAGYAPRKSTERRRFYRENATAPFPVVVYEVPHRLRQSLEDAAAELGDDRLVCMAREMTKQFEEVRRESLGELRQHCATVEPLGEYTLVFGPSQIPAEEATPTVGDLQQAARLALEAGLRTGQAADLLAAASGVSRKQAYSLLLRLRDSLER